jgi:hypothetical protein
MGDAGAQVLPGVEAPPQVEQQRMGFLGVGNGAEGDDVGHGGQARPDAGGMPAR